MNPAIGAMSARGSRGMFGSRSVRNRSLANECRTLLRSCRRSSSLVGVGRWICTILGLEENDIRKIVKLGNYRKSIDNVASRLQIQRKESVSVLVTVVVVWFSNLPVDETRKGIHQAIRKLSLEDRPILPTTDDHRTS